METDRLPFHLQRLFFKLDDQDKDISLLKYPKVRMSKKSWTFFFDILTFEDETAALFRNFGIKTANDAASFPRRT
jgi:hypothetical protein